MIYVIYVIYHMIYEVKLSTAENRLTPPAAALPSRCYCIAQTTHRPFTDHSQIFTCLHICTELQTLNKEAQVYSE